MLLNTIGFYLLSVLALLAAVVLVASRNLLHTVLALAVTSFAVAGLMLNLSAEFIAFVLVLVYIGAVVVIAVFAVMLTGNFNRPTLPSSNELKWLGGVTAVAFAVLIIGVACLQAGPLPGVLTEISVKELGRLLLTEYVLPFELVSVLLLAALVGALVIARGQED